MEMFLKSSHNRFISFDTEWVSGTSQQPASNAADLLQISNGKMCLLIRIFFLLQNNHEAAYPQNFLDFMKNSKYVINSRL